MGNDGLVAVRYYLPMSRTMTVARRAASKMLRRQSGRTAPAEAKPVTAKPPAPRVNEPDKWSELNDSHLAGLETCDPVYRPTNFWGPGVRKLLDELRDLGLPVFKAWPAAHSWFYPTYGAGFTNATMKQIQEFAVTLNPKSTKAYMVGALGGSLHARRDFDAVRLFWNQDRWPFDLNAYGESREGKPPQRFRMTGQDDVAWGRPYLNYLLCLSALSQHVEEPPTSFIEIGGGYGVLGEIVMQRDPGARYVNLDIPPLLTVASYYLTALFGADKVRTSADVAEQGPVTVGATGCLPNWRVADVADQFDVFLNSFSFQEMEPSVVEHYIDEIAKKNVKYVVSLNSKLGKPKAEAAGSHGVIDQVTSSLIIEMFEKRGYQLCGRYSEPLIISAGEIAVLKRI